MCYLRVMAKKRVIPPGIEPGTLSVLDSRDNHYTMESLDEGGHHFNSLSALCIIILQSGNGTMQKKAYSCLGCILSSTGDSHRTFLSEHIAELQQILLDSLSTSSAPSKKVSGGANVMQMHEFY